MNSQSAQPEQPQCWTRRYEELREEAVRGVIAWDCRGASVLIRHGVATWMRAWREPLSPSGTPTVEAENRPITPGGSWQREATLLLANMALSHLRADHP